MLLWYKPILYGIVKIDYKDYKEMSLTEIIDLNIAINIYEERKGSDM